METTGHPHRLSPILGLGASKVYKTTNDPEMALETQCLTGRQFWSLSGHTAYTLLAGGGSCLLAGGRGRSWWTDSTPRGPGWPLPFTPLLPARVFGINMYL